MARIDEWVKGWSSARMVDSPHYTRPAARARIRRRVSVAWGRAVATTTEGRCATGHRSGGQWAELPARRGVVARWQGHRRRRLQRDLPKQLPGLLSLSSWRLAGL